MAKHYGIRYGHDVSGNEIQPREGERILEEGELLPERYRPWLNGSGWLPPQKLHHHPGANLEARVFGNYWAYAVPIQTRVQTPVEVVEVPTDQEDETNAPEPILDVPDVVCESTPEPVVVDPPSVPQKGRKRKSLTAYTNEIVFDDE
jgi:hypothetical protein